MLNFFQSNSSIPELLRVGRYAMPVVVKRNRRAKRICLRYNAKDHAINLTLPQRANMRQGLKFLEQKTSWLEETVSALPPRCKIRPGAIISIFGKETEILYTIDRMHSHELKHGILHVTGPAQGKTIRIKKVLRELFRDEVTAMAHAKAERINKRVNRVSIRDPRTRWGSCSENGNLSFSWRLIFAPYQVLDYVVAHEVAHLRHMNHGARFWGLVEELCPHYERHVIWLREHSHTLFRYII